MVLLWIDQAKKLIKKPFYVVSLSLILFLVIFSFTLIRTLVDRLEAPVSDYYATQNVEDFSIVLGQIDFSLLTAEQRARVCAIYPIALCASLNERDPRDVARLTETIQRSIHQYPEVYDVVFGPLIAQLSTDYDLAFEKSVGANVEADGSIYRFISINTEINRPLITDGRLPEGPNEAAIYAAYAKANHLEIGDELNVRNQTLTITGFFFSPEHTSPMIRANELNFDPKTQTLVLVEEAVIYAFRVPFTVKYVGRGDFTTLYDRFDVADILTADLRAFGKNMQMVQAVVPAAFNLRITAITTETQTAAAFASVFLGVFSVFSVTVLMVFVKRHLDQQTRDMSILNAQGYTVHERALALTLIGFLLALIAVSAFGLGLWFANRLFLSYAVRYQLPQSHFFIPVDVRRYAGILPLVLLPMMTYMYARMLFRSSHKQLSRFKIHVQLLTRHAMQGVLFLLVSVLLVFGLSSRAIIDDFKATTMQGNHYENVVFLSRFTTQKRSGAEPFSSGIVTVTAHRGTNLSTSLRIQGYGLDESITLKRLIDDTAESNALLKEGAIITRQAAALHGFSVGDTLTLRVGPRTHQTVIVGLNDNLIEAAVFLDQATFNRLYGLSNQYFNAYYTLQENVRDSDAFRILNYRAIAEEIDVLFNLSATIATVMMTLAIGLSLLLFVFMMQQALDAQKQVFLTLRALGYTAAETYRIFFLKSLLTLGVAFAAAIWFSAQLQRVVLSLLQDTLGFVFIIEARPLSTVLAGVIVFALVLLTTLFIHRRVLRIPLADVLKLAH
ncbi:MAG: ABC transporter permease [Acholeplasmatales bacterium]|nr:MAG: ABC transporter permease [Acholeplasmatales bacterium]